MPLGPEARYDPEARYEQTESITLAFVTALQVLPPRQLAVLILRDVLGFRGNEVADMLDSTVESVNSALKRARASLRRQLPPGDDRERPPAAGSPAEDAIVARFVNAWQAADLDALVALLTDDVFVSMPPMPLEYEGRDVVARFVDLIFGAGPGGKRDDNANRPRRVILRRERLRSNREQEPRECGGQCQCAKHKPTPVIARER